MSEKKECLINYLPDELIMHIAQLSQVNSTYMRHIDKKFKMFMRCNRKFNTIEWRSRMNMMEAEWYYDDCPETKDWNTILKNDILL